MNNKVRCVFYGLLMAALCSCSHTKKQSYDEVGASGLTVRTEFLSTNLKSMTDKGMMVGHVNGTVSGIGWRGDSLRADFHECCNDFPAIVSYDVTGIEKGLKVNADSIGFSAVHKAILAQYKRGGVNMLTWNTPNPFNGKNPTIDEVKQLMKDNTPAYKMLKEWTRVLARYLNSLRDPYGIKSPVLLSLFPKSQSDDAWWNNKNVTADVYKGLWKQMRSWLKSFGVNNVLFVYSEDVLASDVQVFNAYYPGDENIYLIELRYVQLKADCNLSVYKQTMENVLQTVVSTAQAHNKMIGFRTGMQGIPVKDWWTSTLLPLLKPYKITYLLLEKNEGNPKDGKFYAPYPGEKSVAYFVQLYNDPLTLFMNDVNGLYFDHTKKKRE